MIASIALFAMIAISRLLLDDPGRLGTCPCVPNPFALLGTERISLADAAARDSASHPVTTALAALGGAGIGYLVGGPTGAVIGFIAGAEIAAHEL